MKRYKGIIIDFEKELDSKKEDILISFFQEIIIKKSLNNKAIKLDDRIILKQMLELRKDDKNKKRYYFILPEAYEYIDAPVPFHPRVKVIQGCSIKFIHSAKELCKKLGIDGKEMTITGRFADGEFIELPE